MKQLSPEAGVVLDAGLLHAVHRYSIAAALRAAVTHTQQRQYNECWICDANELLAIADELEAE